MPVIPLRTLRNDVSDVLRRAEAGERFVITVAGRAVAELGPVTGERFVAGARIRDALAGLAAVDGLLVELRDAGGGYADPFA